ncbi:hypothetical protein TUBRATIS_14810 [Tubulinosema ratisbonensis]|uniref:Uncharacterized protein n=1 Tax=Tubulinosema ratisbonensis TaxID=291195 RepID=A0A437ALS2_9MICR|nr:hypothetical protein TUBRATIS_14810 [Tubulinosema ratisbonensis]
MVYSIVNFIHLIYGSIFDDNDEFLQFFTIESVFEDVIINKQPLTDEMQSSTFGSRLSEQCLRVQTHIKKDDQPTVSIISNKISTNIHPLKKTTKRKQLTKENKVSDFKISDDSNKKIKQDKILVKERVGLIRSQKNQLPISKMKKSIKNKQQLIENENMDYCKELYYKNEHKLLLLEKVVKKAEFIFKFPFFKYVNLLFNANFRNKSSIDFADKDNIFRTESYLKLYDLLTGFFDDEKLEENLIIPENFLLWDLTLENLKMLKMEYDKFIKNLQISFKLIKNFRSGGEYFRSAGSKVLSWYKNQNEIRGALLESIKIIQNFSFLSNLCGDLNIFFQINYEIILKKNLGQIYFYLQTIIYVYEINKSKFIIQNEIDISNIYYRNRNLLKFVVFVRYLVLEVLYLLEVEDEHTKTYKALIFMSFIRYKYPETALKFNFYDIILSKSLYFNDKKIIYLEKEKRTISIVFKFNIGKDGQGSFLMYFNKIREILIYTIQEDFNNLTKSLIEFNNCKCVLDEYVSLCWTNDIINIYVKDFHRKVIESFQIESLKIFYKI